MDKEMMNKVNDVLKAKGMRELSMDEMDKISGGAGECLSAKNIWTGDDLDYYVYTFLASMEKAYGKDYVKDFIKSDAKDLNAAEEYSYAGLAGVYNYLGKKRVERVIGKSNSFRT